MKGVSSSLKEDFVFVFSFSAFSSLYCLPRSLQLRKSSQITNYCLKWYKYKTRKSHVLNVTFITNSGLTDDKKSPTKCSLTPKKTWGRYQRSNGPEYLALMVKLYISVNVIFHFSFLKFVGKKTLYLSLLFVWWCFSSRTKTKTKPWLIIMALRPSCKQTRCLVNKCKHRPQTSSNKLWLLMYWGAQATATVWLMGNLLLPAALEQGMNPQLPQCLCSVTCSSLSRPSQTCAGVTSKKKLHWTLCLCLFPIRQQDGHRDAGSLTRSPPRISSASQPQRTTALPTGRPQHCYMRL